MPSHRLIVEGGQPTEEWLLEWDKQQFTLKTPDGQTAFDSAIAHAHRLIEIYELYTEGKISLATPDGPLTFKPHREAVRDVRAYLEKALASDAEYRVQLKTQAHSAMLLGLGAFLIGGIPFGAYCWWASWAPDPPAGHWMYSVGWLIHLVLLVLMAMTLAGPFIVFVAMRQLLRIRKIERSTTATN